MNENTCGICLESVEEKEMAPLHCKDKHQFHAKCMIEWWQQQDENRSSLTCPTCKEVFRNSGNPLLKRFETFVARNYATPLERTLIDMLNKQRREMDNQFILLFTSVVVNISTISTIVYFICFS